MAHFICFWQERFHSENATISGQVSSINQLDSWWNERRTLELDRVFKTKNFNDTDPQLDTARELIRYIDGFEGEDYSFTDHGSQEHSWKTFLNPLKANVLRHLANEQQGYCCYCERLLQLDPQECSIEHWQCRDDYESRMFDHTNLFATCGPGSLPYLNNKQPRHPQTCGDATR